MKTQDQLTGRIVLGFHIVSATDIEAAEMAATYARVTGSKIGTYTDGERSAKVERKTIA